MKIYIDRITNKAVNQSSQSPLFLEVAIEDDFKLEKTIKTQEGEVQKTNSQGQPLYKTNLVIDEMGTESYEETTESQVAVAFREVTQKVTIFDEEGNGLKQNIVVKEPTAWEPLEAIMVPRLVSETVNIKEHPEYFTLNEIIEAKYKGILKASNCNYIVADLFIDENDLDLTDIKHSANTGYGIFQLLPNGQAKTKMIDLEVPSMTFTLLEFEADPDIDIYIDEKKFTDGSVKLSSPVSRCAIKFVNTSNRIRSANAYAIGY